MAREITVAEVDQAEAELAAAKKGKDRVKRQEAMDRVSELRLAWRAQEEAAGRRVGIAAVQTNPEG